jgi:Methyltransferase domain
MFKNTELVRRFVPATVRDLLGSFPQWKAMKSGFDYEFKQNNGVASAISNETSPPNALRKFFDERTHGPGIWKWLHYFDIYDRHFARFRGKEVHILEIGIYSGGSLEMWRDYFGPNAHIYGVDIEPDCRLYERDGVKVFIGDQEDRKFWEHFRENVPALDIVVDDGGHSPEQQTVTLEELLPFLRPGGVYLCEDVHGEFNRFASYVHGLGHKLNHLNTRPQDPCTPFQSAIGSIHLYPFVAVLEKNAVPLDRLAAPKHGTQWQPFNPGSKSAD